MAVMVELTGRALELAQRMVDDGTCATLDEAVGRSLAIAYLHDTTPVADAGEAGGPAGVSRLADEIQRQVDSGALGGNAPELWRVVRAQISSLASSSAR